MSRKPCDPDSNSLVISDSGGALSNFNSRKPIVATPTYSVPSSTPLSAITNRASGNFQSPQPAVSSNSSQPSPTVTAYPLASKAVCSEVASVLCAIDDATQSCNGETSTVNQGAAGSDPWPITGEVEATLTDIGDIATEATSTEILTTLENNIGPLAVRLDDSASPVSYAGKAATGASPAAAVWQIQEIDETTGLIVTWADGNANFDNVWNDRASLSYS